MQNNCPNPGCGAVYNLTSQHVGRTFTCRKCNSPLVVTSQGLELASGATGGVSGDLPDAGDDMPPVRSRRRGANPFGGLWDRIRADLPSWFFGIGAFLVIVFLFFPMIDAAKVDRRKVRIEEGEMKLQRQKESLARRRLEDKDGKNAEKLDKEKERLDKDEESWKKKREELQEDVDSAGFSRRSSLYWYQWGLMFGFLFLTVGALGYVGPQQPTIRRIVGCIILCALVVFVLQRVLSVSGLFRLQVGM